MWTTIAKAIDDAQGWLIDAKKAEDAGKCRIYMKMVADRTSAMLNLQKLAFGDLIESVSSLRGRAVVHSRIEVEPPGIVIYDTEEEYYTDVQAFRDELESDGEEGTYVQVHTRLGHPAKPVNPEGLD